MITHTSLTSILRKKVSTLASLFSHQPLYPDWVTNNKGKYNFCTTMILNDLGLAMRWVENISSTTMMPQEGAPDSEDDNKYSTFQPLVFISPKRKTHS